MSNDRLTLTVAAELLGKHRNTVRTWAREGKLTTAALEEEAGSQVWRVDRAEVESLVGGEPAEVVGGTTTAPTTTSEEQPPTWAIELLARADARNDVLLSRLADAERDRADAEKEARIAEHKLESARSEAEELRAEVGRLSEKPRRWWRRSKEEG